MLSDKSRTELVNDHYKLNFTLDDMMIREVNKTDAKQIVDIYNDYIVHSVITFEEQALSVEEMEARILNVINSGHVWLVFEQNNEVLGYAYSSKWRERTAYRFASEISVYLAESAKGQGIGSKLYQALFEQLRQTDIHLVIGGITLPNDASVALHEKFGMEKVAHFKEVGFKFNQWLDVGYWQKVL